MMLDDLGVVPTLRRYAESFQEKNGIPVPITVTGVERRLESHIEVTVFRNVQELLQNAMSHAQATQIQIQIDMAQEQVTAVVEDNGSGFNVDDALNGNNKTIGLATLRERTEMLGGELNIQSNVGQGTRIEFSIPIADEINL
jgi:two-component system sensor histidine kinase DegS